MYCTSAAPPADGAAPPPAEAAPPAAAPPAEAAPPPEPAPAPAPAEGESNLPGWTHHKHRRYEICYTAKKTFTDSRTVFVAGCYRHIILIQYYFHSDNYE